MALMCTHAPACRCERCEKLRLSLREQAGEQDDLVLVQQDSVQHRQRTLADLYRAGRAKGLLTQRNGY